MCKRDSNREEKKKNRESERVHTDCYDWSDFPNWHVDLRAYVLRLYWMCSVSVMFNKLPDSLLVWLFPPAIEWLQNREGREERWRRGGGEEEEEKSLEEKRMKKE